MRELWQVKGQRVKEKGAKYQHSNLAIATMITLGSVLKLAGRQTAGFVESLLKLMGVELSVTGHSAVSRQLGQLSISLPKVSLNIFMQQSH